MDDDIQRAIDRIDEKIRELEKAKQTLMQTFGVRMPGLTRRRYISQSPSVSPSPSASLSDTTRKIAIRNLIEDKGPMTKADILKETGFPEGTVSYVLNDKETFKNVEGKWHLVGGEPDDVEDKEKSQIPS